MVIVASVALATMISNDLVMPALLRLQFLRLDQRNDVSAIVLGIRRIAIIVLALLALAYYRAVSQSQGLAAIGLLAFAAVAQFAPAIIAGLYWRGASRRGVLIGLVIGFAVWIYTLLLPSMATAEWFDDAWVRRGPVRADLAAPACPVQPEQLGSDHARYVLVAAGQHRRLRVRLAAIPARASRSALRAASFLDAGPERNPTGAGEWHGRVSIADLRTITGRILGDRNAASAFADYASDIGQRARRRGVGRSCACCSTPSACSRRRSVRPRRGAC